ncbi:MAG: DUF1727 domain-containing protein [Clostridia bacterium]|nr:DUF1727 domain-containing protein [Clostridia bacterium]
METIKRTRFYFAMAAGKAVALLLRALGRRATHLPGAVALKICGELFSFLHKPEILICVTGTNGKTTTANLITSMLRGAGLGVTNNSTGSNTAGGIASALLENSTLTGKHKNKYAVIEVDERSSLKFYPFMSPDHLLCTNIMPDSILRNAHPEFISYIINSSVHEKTKVFLNADDIICANLVPQCGNRTYFGVSADAPSSCGSTTVKNMVYCPKCGAPMAAEYLRFEHIGRVRCTSCEFGSPEPDFCVTDINKQKGCFTVESGGERHIMPIVNDNIVNIYNSCAAISLLASLGFSFENIGGMLGKSHIVKDRYEQITAGDLRVTMILAKGLNAVAVGSVFRYIASLPGDKKCLLLLIDDREYNERDSEITCWLYDLDYTPLDNPGISKAIFAGKRCLDHQLRVAMSGLDRSKFIYTAKVDCSSDLIDISQYKDVYVLYSAYFIDEAMREKERLKRRGEKVI